MRMGRLDLLVNNASLLGPSPQPRLGDYPLDVLEQVYRVNVVAPLRLVQLALPLLAEAKGRITNALLNEEDRRNVKAFLIFDVPRNDEAAIQAVLTAGGEALARKVERQQENAAVTDNHGRTAPPTPQTGGNGAPGPPVPPHRDQTTPSTPTGNTPPAAAGGSAHDDSAPRGSPHGG